MSEASSTPEPSPAELVDRAEFGKLCEGVDSGRLDVNAPSPATGETALHACAGKLLTNAAEYLLSKGADPNRRSQSGSTPLHKLCASPLSRNRDLFERSARIARALVAAGADPAATNAARLSCFALLPSGNFPLRKALMASPLCASKTVSVPMKLLGQIIGAGGKNVQAMQERHSVVVEIPNDRSGSGDSGISVTVMGGREGVEAAVGEVTGVVERAAKEEEKTRETKARRAEDDTEARIPIDPEWYGNIIGKRGTRLREIEEQFDVGITMPRAGGEEGVLIRGKVDNVHGAAEYLNKFVAEQQEAKKDRQRALSQQQNRNRRRVGPQGQTFPPPSQQAASAGGYAPAPRSLVRIDVKGSRRGQRGRPAFTEEGTPSSVAPVATVPAYPVAPPPAADFAKSPAEAFGV